MLTSKLNAVFNIIMNDKELIAHLGGPAKVAEMLSFEKDGGVQRVHNWIERGIPPKVKLEFPHIFLTPEADAAPPTHHLAEDPDTMQPVLVLGKAHAGRAA